MSESLRPRPDRGLVPAALGRPDIENFLNRLAYLESTGKITRYRRNVICRGTRAALTGIRALGLTRPGQAAAGLPDVFAIGVSDIPRRAGARRTGARPATGDHDRALRQPGQPKPAEVKVATQIAIDTGRRPEDILDLPLNCLHRDQDGGAVLVYDNAKADRLGRRLPISQATATVITDQQQRVRSQFPDTPAGQLKLLPAPRRNPDGRRPISISMLDHRHRAWVAALGLLRTRDGVEFDPTKIFPYAYRHTYAQRHADAGIGIDVLAELLDHRNFNATRSYYNSRELHQMGEKPQVVWSAGLRSRAARLWPGCA